MMKRILCLAVCLAMLCTFAWALADDYTLTEKLQRQIEFGNGVKGAFVLEAKGKGDLAQLLAPLNGTEFQLRSIQSDGKFQLSLYTLDGEKQVGTTRFYGDDQDVYMVSDLLPQLILTYHTGGNAVDALIQRGEDENPNWYTAALDLLTVPETVWAENWEPLLGSYYADLEMWMADFAQEPQIAENAQGEKIMTVRYEIPAEAVKAQAKVVLQKALNDAALMTLVRAQLSQAQQTAYLTPGFLYYYEAAIDALPLEGELLLERELSTMGETLSTAMQLPLPGNAAWTELAYEQTQTDTVLTLQGSAMSVSVEMETAQSSATSAAYSGTVHVTPETDGAQAVAVSFDLTRTSSHTVDNDTRAHDVNNWELSVRVEESVQGDADYLNFEPIHAAVMTHVHSKNAKGNATTLEVSLLLSQGAESLALAGSIKTASPWVLDPLPEDGAEDVSQMSESYLAEVMGEWWVNLLAELSALKPADLPAPEVTVEPTAVPTAELTAEPTTEPTVVPTAEPVAEMKAVPITKKNPAP